jgi:hypothetical protein
MLAITAAGIASADGTTGLVALASIARWPGAPEIPRDRAARESLAARGPTGAGCLDPASESGIRAVEAAGGGSALDSGGSRADEPSRTGVVLASRFGPETTRVMAEARGIRGPSLTLAAAPGWGARVLRVAEVLFARGRADRLFLAYIDADAAIVLRAEPWARVAPRTPVRALCLVRALGGASERPCLVLRPRSAQLASPVADVASRARAVEFRVPSAASGLALDPTFLSLAWLWESAPPEAPGPVVAAFLRADAVVAFAPNGSLEDAC